MLLGNVPHRAERDLRLRAGAMPPVRGTVFVARPRVLLGELPHRVELDVRLKGNASAARLMVRVPESENRGQPRGRADASV